MEVLRSYVDGDYEVVEYTDDGKNISHIAKTLIQTELIEEHEFPDFIIQPTIEEQILAELQYNTALTEMKMLGGI